MFVKGKIAFILFMAMATAFAVAVEINWSVMPSHSPAEPARGDTVTVSGQILVSGGDVTRLRVVGGIDETTIMDRTFAVVNDGETKNLSFTYTARPGSHNYWMDIDPDNVSGDASPHNNLTRGGFRVSDPLSRPDLHIWWSSFSVVPTRFFAGDAVTFHIGFGNIGTADAGPFDVGIRSGGVIVARQHFDGMAVGANTTVDLAWTAACAEDNAIIIDCDHTLTEPNEEDNTLDDDRVHCDSSWHESLNFSFSDIRPDTRATPLSLSGSPTTISATLNFSGGVGRTALNVRVEMGIVGRGGIVSETIPVMRLPGDETRTVSFKTVLPAGDNRVFFEVDTDRHLAEMNEGDNRIEGVVRVQDPSRAPMAAPRLTAKAAALLPLNYGVAIAGKAELGAIAFSALRPLKVAGRLKVSGTPAAAAIKVHALLSGTTREFVAVKRSQDLAVAANAEVPFEFSFPMPPAGAYKVEVRVNLADANAADNSDSAPIRIR